MNGTAIIAELLAADAWFAALIAGDRMKEDRLPDGVALTAILLRTVSRVDRRPLTRGAFLRSTERVAVTVRAGSVRERKVAIGRVRAACIGRTGDIVGTFRVSVQPAGLGPSMTGPADSFEQTQDFSVSFDAPL